MRPGEGRPGQRVYLSLSGEDVQRVEGLFLLEEGHLANVT